MRVHSSDTALCALVLALIIALSAGLATDAIAADTDPSDAVIARFTIDPAELSEVQNTADLVDALHRELRLDGSSPLDYEVIVHLLGNIYQDREQPPHSEGSGIMLNLEKGKPLKGHIKDLRFYTYGDFSESEAWEFFRGSIEQALLYSMNSSGSFEAGEDGPVWLTVDSVVDGAANIEANGSSMVLELTAELNYRDGSKFGRKEPPEGYQQILQTIQLVLSPAAVQISDEPEPEPALATNVAVATAAESDGITGVYGYEPGGLRIEKKDDQYVMSDVRKSPPVYMPLTPIGKNYFSVDYNGVPAKLKFSVDDEGIAFAMTVEQQGHGMKLPRE